jgi:hypothetical protein
MMMISASSKALARRITMRLTLRLPTDFFLHYESQPAFGLRRLRVPKSWESFPPLRAAQSSGESGRRCRR